MRYALKRSGNSAVLFASDGCCCEVIRSFLSLSAARLFFFGRGFVCDSYRAFACRSRRVHIVHFPSSLPPSSSHEIHPTFSTLSAVFKCHGGQQQQAAIADDTVEEDDERNSGMGMGMGEECHTRKFFERTRNFSVTKLLCCHVDGEKLCAPHFRFFAPEEASRAEEHKKFVSL